MSGAGPEADRALPLREALPYYASLPLLYLLSVLPFWMLYRLSDLLYLLVYRVIGYRKKVVTENLKNAFPGKPAAEREALRRRFYRYFCDLCLETVKLLSISPAALEKRVGVGDLSAIERYYRQDQSVILVTGHLGNWEWGAAAFNRLPYHPLYAIYHPLANRGFDRLFQRMRARLGTGLYPMKGAFRGMLKNRGEVTATAFIADQTPPPASAHWVTFMNQDTPVFRGAEVIARALDYPVVYVALIRERRGRYRLDSELLVEHPRQLEDNELTEMHTRRLQRDILRYPETWLWSHRRWKHRRAEGEQAA